MVNKKVKKVTIGVDKKFFVNIFEQQRIKMQRELGVINLTQVNFTKMIEGLKIRDLKQDLSQVKTKRGKKKNERFLF